MERLVLEFAVRAILIAASAAVVILALRVRSAAAQHALWTGVLVAMLALPLWIAWGPKAGLPLLPAQKPPLFATPVAFHLPIVSGPAIAAAPHEQPAPATRVIWNWRIAGLAVYSLIVAALLLRLAIGTFRALRLTEASCTTPISVGFFRPRILLPVESASWPPAQLAAVLAHECAHVRRHDPLVQWLAALNAALFWFHPLAWWLERRLGALAEEACDAAVLNEGHDAADYSALLVQLARTVERAGARVNAIGIAMPGNGLARRVPRILNGDAIARISPMKLAAAALACAVCAALSAAATVMQASQDSTQASAPAARPKFEVASIRPCKDSDITPGGKQGGRGGGARLGRVRGDPGNLVAECQTVENLVRWAYLGYPDGKAWPVDPNMGMPWQPLPDRIFRQEIKGPGWISSDRYTIEAKAPSPASIEMMRGPMMQTLLQDRFGLKIRVENRDVPVYYLTVADGGPKLQPKQGECISAAEFGQRYRFEPPKPGEPMPRVCGAFRASILDRQSKAELDVQNRAIGVDTPGQTMTDLCRQFSTGSSREIIDRTGLTGAYDIHLDLALQDLFPSGPGPADSSEPPPSPEEKTAHIMAAVRKLGLELKPGTTPAPFVVIDHVDRPTEN